MKIENSLVSANINSQTSIRNIKYVEEVSKIQGIDGNTNMNENADIPLSQKPQYELSIGEKALIKAIEDANKKLVGAQKEVRFSIHEATKQIMIKIVNIETNEVIREIPPEKILDVVAKIIELSGIFVDERR
ncbi:flagellar protein FlaG [Caloranaerobacter ferrireducens]|uniref:flagellar protein FlaG n=1 Tax=Caloranaerobacter ferrireducens TaxID=1323370 RepID=UPI00084DF9F5|nr:flagellar protein FlaG [Caloranaerobacter ferrireducens]